MSYQRYRLGSYEFDTDGKQVRRCLPTYQEPFFFRRIDETDAQLKARIQAHQDSILEGEIVGREDAAPAGGPIRGLLPAADAHRE
ncbi:MAG: hypothetical protein KGL39_39050 [Patescibacteria group bacterium]|nr:hypothetical protein [Patescibacteria group bacterium]